MHQIEIEIDSLMDNIIKAGKGDIASGIIEAFKSGIIDVPFAPSKYNLGKILPARDNQGYIRILEFGNLGFNDEIKKSFINLEFKKELTMKNVHSHLI